LGTDGGGGGGGGWFGGGAGGSGAVCTSEFAEAGSGGGGAGSSHVEADAISASIGRASSDDSEITITPRFDGSGPGSGTPGSEPPDVVGPVQPQPDAGASGSSGLLAFTGIDVIRTASLGALFLAVGAFLLVRRRRARL
jgi:hypothetical protein